jgi:DNA polymerase (family 10)
LIGTRDESALDIEQMFAVAVETGTIVEVDGTPERMDLDGVHVRRALEVGCKVVIDSDAHNPDGFDDLFWGVAMARRGWATAGDVLNTLEWDELRPRLKRNRR